MPVLQWGHGLSAMDTRAAPTSRSDTASSFNGATAFSAMDTRPIPVPVPDFTDTLQWSHGLSAMDTACAVVTVCPAFNGATAFQPWIRGCYLLFGQAAAGLQWSHGLSAMDTCMAAALGKNHITASMEPWPFSHGYGD